MKILLALLVLLPILGADKAIADTKTEIELRARIAQMQASLDSAARERGSLAAALNKASAKDAAGTVKSDKALRSVSQEQLAYASDASVAAETAARRLAEADAARAASVKEVAVVVASAKTAAESTKAQNEALLIVQAFALFALVLGIAERLWTRRSEHRWKEESDAKAAETASTVNQVHALVNSSYTAALENELTARNSNLVLLKANLVLLQANGQKVPEIEAITITIADVAAKISELTKLILDRQQATILATKQFAIPATEIPPPINNKT